MLHKKLKFATLAIVTLSNCGFPVSAEVSTDDTASPKVSAANAISVGKSTLVAQATPDSLGAETADVAAVGALSGAKKLKGELLITDSLWGNLILDLAYQRDPQLRRYSKRMNILNLSTTATVTGIAGGTLAQGVIALSTLNPPAPKSDSYLPGSIGVGFAGLTLVAFGARTLANMVLVKQIRTRQLAIKHEVEAILNAIEDSHGESSLAQKELVGLIGQRASNEWLQLWRSSNVVATLKQPDVSTEPAPANKIDTQGDKRTKVSLRPSAVLMSHQM